MKINRKRIIKCLLIAIFMTLMFMLIRLPDQKSIQEGLLENLNWKSGALYFTGLFILYYFIDELNNQNQKKKSSLNKKIK